MIDDKTYQELREASWRRPLSSQEEAMLQEWLAGHPQDQEEWPLERSLNKALQALPDSPVPSNFTSRLLQSVELEKQNSARSRTVWRWALPGSWIFRGALASAVMAAGLLTFTQVKVQQRQELANSLTTVSAVASVPGADVFEDFEAIRAMSSTPRADEELLTLLQ